MAEHDLQSALQQRIVGSVTRDDGSECWVWNRQISNSGYGRLMLSDADGTRFHSAHRVSYVAFVGGLSDDAVVRQTCGNRLCVNPDHLQRIPLA